MKNGLFIIALLICLCAFLPTPAPAATPEQIHEVFTSQSGGRTMDAQPKNRPAPRHGNYTTMKFHNEFCDHYDCRTCTKIFKTKEAALKAGYQPCGKCGG